MHDDHLGGVDDDSHAENYDDDVSSEGSCRTSIYNRSQHGDDEGSFNKSLKNHTAAGSAH
jgi:hypothetical protein